MDGAGKGQDDPLGLRSLGPTILCVLTGLDPSDALDGVTWLSTCSVLWFSCYCHHQIMMTGGTMFTTIDNRYHFNLNLTTKAQ